MNPATPRVTDALNAVTDSLAAVPTPPFSADRAQSLADGAAGAALFHIESALAGTGQWETAHRWLNIVVHGGVLATTDSSLYRGAPAVAFALHIAATDRHDQYAKARQAVDKAVTALAHRRVNKALDRIARGDLPTMAEYDLISGLTGIGAHLLRHTSNDDALSRVLAYLVRLTDPLRHSGEPLPGWWTEQDPHAATSRAFPGGHANLGLAHGIAGPLALLALATRRNIVVDGHLDAIERICAWLDTWRQHSDNGIWWPQWITHADRRTGRPAQAGPLRPSWCYGTAGLGRAQQLAALATDDVRRRQIAEQALMSCLTDPQQLDRIGDASVCHGWAGLLLTVWRAATDAPSTTLGAHLPKLVDHLIDTVATESPSDGLLEGYAGIALALHAAERGELPVSEWDTCLLIN